MRRRMPTLVKVVVVPAAVAATLTVAGPAQADEAAVAPGDQSTVQVVPMIGSGTHPVEATDDSWGVGNG